MIKRNQTPIKVILGMLLMLCVLFAGCGSGIAPEPRDKATQPTDQAVTTKPVYTLIPATVVTHIITPSPKPTATPIPTPAGKLAGLIIGVDAGHQQKGDSKPEPVAPGSTETKARVSTGTRGVDSGVYEYVVNLQVALKLQALLEAEGATVIMVRTTHEVNISNMERAQMMNEANADLVIRIHCNGSDNRSVHGVLMMTPSSGKDAQESYRASELILTQVLAMTGAKDMGIQKHADLTGFNWSTVPSTLIEMGFMTNPQEDRNLNDSAYQDQLAQGMLQGIIRYFEEK